MITFIKLASYSLILVLMASSGLTHAMTEWDTLNQEWESLYEQGDYNRATAVAPRRCR